ncbi:MAG: glutamate--tRNA ligase [Deltaproteobacteria bacterium]|nr:glutamate--tRNA ligase [Deltaproteobacteria bacterium]
MDQFQQPIRVRMAPSPTGFLHIGGARTALFNYLFARHMGGTFVLRIEDTDRERSEKKYEEAILQDLRWLGLDWDEGPERHGSYGPYYQTQRLSIYAGYLNQLHHQQKTYACYCSPHELEAERQELLKRKKTPRYMGKCRSLTDQEKKKFEQEGRSPVIRFKVDESKVIEFDDLIRGKVQVDPKNIGDFVIAKGDGMPLYNFAAAIDDTEMKISHVIRGEEHLSNTPRQLLILKALNLKAPLYAHVSIILAPDRSKLSKRHGATSLGEYQKLGYLPEALFNYLALLGWNPGDEREVMTSAEIIREFTIEKMTKSPAIFDVQKLSWMNGIYIRNANISELSQNIKPFLEEAGFSVSEKDPVLIEKIVEGVRGNLEHLNQIGNYADIFFDEKFKLEEDAKKHLKDNQEVATEILEALLRLLEKYDHMDVKAYETIQEELKKTVKAKGKLLFLTQRAALTGKLKGPEMVFICTTLPVASLKKRLQTVLTALS